MSQRSRSTRRPARSRCCATSRSTTAAASSTMSCSRGQLLTGSFMDYAMPRAHMLGEVRLFDKSVPAPGNPLGVKGVGEAGTVGAIPSVANAVIDALRPLGIHHLDF